MDTDNRAALDPVMVVAEAARVVARPTAAVPLVALRAAMVQVAAKVEAILAEAVSRTTTFLVFSISVSKCLKVVIDVFVYTI